VVGVAVLIAGSCSTILASVYPASANISIERRMIPPTHGCREMAILVNRSHERRIGVHILKIQHLFSGSLSETFFVSLRPDDRVSLGCSWFRGALQRTSYEIIHAEYSQRRHRNVDDWPDHCVGEGDGFRTAPGHPDCCEGLIAVSPSELDNQGECKERIGRRVCIRCGDGVCGEGENRCRCPEDCTEER
jgi:hypothetical protein